MARGRRRSAQLIWWPANRFRLTCEPRADSRGGRRPDPTRAAASRSCAATPTGRSTTCCRRDGTRAHASTSTAGARGGCTTEWSSPLPGPISACTGQRPAPIPSLTPEPGEPRACATPTGVLGAAAPSCVYPRPADMRSARDRGGRRLSGTGRAFTGTDFVPPRRECRRRHLAWFSGSPQHAVGRHDAVGR
jgi:hypothetical protein